MAIPQKNAKPGIVINITNAVHINSHAVSPVFIMSPLSKHFFIPLDG